MTDQSRLLGWVGLALAFAMLFLALSCGQERPVDVPPVRVDSSHVEAVRDSLSRALSVERRRADSLATCLDTCPSDTVVKWLSRKAPAKRDTVRDTTHDTVRIDAGQLRAAAESLAGCWFDRDSLAGEVTLWKIRDAAHAEAFRLAQERPAVVGDTSPPSRATWAAVGAASALLGVSTFLLLTR